MKSMLTIQCIQKNCTAYNTQGLPATAPSEWQNQAARDECPGSAAASPAWRCSHLQPEESASGYLPDVYGACHKACGTLSYDYTSNKNEKPENR